ncbi:MAG: hypothetical protein L3J95_02025 [Thermoplasmata archaeon]|nr:hypothetical protein [Thermoplasmata archaeon]MCI4359189.1 hypothetical protein [Thermoplasmata archaeon]
MRVRRASGGREGELVRRASRLRDSVEPLVPKLARDCPPERFDRLRRDLEEVREARDDQHRLDRMRRWGEPIPRAYAGLLRFYLEPELPALIVARYPAGEISYAPLSKASREAEVAVQNSDDPTRLLLGYLDWARKGFHFFATDDVLYCTGSDPAPPEEFRTRQLAHLPYRLQTAPEGRALDCPHLAPGSHVPFLEVDWTGAQTRVRLCRRCAKSDRHLLADLSSNAAIPDPESAFRVTVSLNAQCDSAPDCPHRHLPGLSRGVTKRYHFGKLSDREVLDEYVAGVLPLFERSRSPIFVSEGNCFGPDRKRFIDSLEPTPEEQAALERVLPEVQGLFEVEEATASRALEKLWPDHAETIVQAIVPDPERASRLVKEARSAPGRVSELLHRAARATREREALDALPQYHGLVPEATFLDSIARAYRSQGARASEKLLLDRLPREGKQRGIAFGLLVVLGKESAHLWQFTDTEQNFGRSLVPWIGPVLKAPPEEYHAALDRVLGAAGVAEWGTPL